ncbi:hypothetical protein SERLADRAFT_401236, partial [Serpula lacrymans var. lacrymans S7.9]
RTLYARGPFKHTQTTYCVTLTGATRNSFHCQLRQWQYTTIDKLHLSTHVVTPPTHVDANIQSNSIFRQNTHVHRGHQEYTKDVLRDFH